MARAPAPQTAEPAPQLRLPSLAGDVVDLSDLRGRPVIVSFLRHAG